jgi:hypothetical protein
MCNAIWPISNALNQDQHHQDTRSASSVLSSTYSSPVPLQVPIPYTLVSAIFSSRSHQFSFHILQHRNPRRRAFDSIEAILIFCLLPLQHAIAQSTLSTPKLNKNQRIISLPHLAVPVSDSSTCHPCWLLSACPSLLTFTASPVSWTAQCCMALIRLRLRFK